LGIAAAIAWWITFIVLTLYLALHPSFKQFKLFSNPMAHHNRWAMFKALSKIGLPIGGKVAVSLETVPAAELDSTETGQVAIQLDSAPSCE
jgi:Na+-driven multidrug efflux pump